MESETIKENVRKAYGAVARDAQAKESSCCGSGCCGVAVAPGAGMNEGYDREAGYQAEADLGLGCGIPTRYANLQPGETVLDLGSGSGNDVFVARESVGPQGHVIGVDMTPEMISVSRKHASRLGFTNVDFRLGEIEHLPVDAQSVDLILSNCVLNLVPNKSAAFHEMARVLKPGGRFAVSDIVFEGQFPESLHSVTELVTGCIAGGIEREHYLKLLGEAGFKQIEIPESKEWHLPETLVQEYIPEGSSATEFLKGFRILKITVTGQR